MEPFNIRMSSKKLIVTVTSVNVKKIDLKFCGVSIAMQVKVTVNDKCFETRITAPGEGLDPKWEETFEFPVEDEKTAKCSATFYMNDKHRDDGVDWKPKQIGDTHDYLLTALVTGKPTFKAIIVPGGQVEMMFTAVGFGLEDKPDTGADDFLAMMDDADGGMMMDDDEEETK